MTFDRMRPIYRVHRNDAGLFEWWTVDPDHTFGRPASRDEHIRISLYLMDMPWTGAFWDAACRAGKATIYAPIPDWVMPQENANVAG